MTLLSPKNRLTIQHADPIYPELTASFYQREDVLTVARELLGKVLVTKFGGFITSGMITEVEAYMAPEDKASHAFGNRRTGRTEVMFAKGGHAYVYLCYGIHHLFNVVTGPQDMAHAVLIRAIEPIENVEMMMFRRRQEVLSPRLTAGPGSLSSALGIDRMHTGINMLAEDALISIEDRGIYLNADQIVSSPRIGVDYAAEWTAKPWRFYIRDSKWISKK